MPVYLQPSARQRQALSLVAPSGSALPRRVQVQRPYLVIPTPWTSPCLALLQLGDGRKSCSAEPRCRSTPELRADGSPANAPAVRPRSWMSECVSDRAISSNKECLKQTPAKNESEIWLCAQNFFPECTGVKCQLRWRLWEGAESQSGRQAALPQLSSGRHPKTVRAAYSES